MIRAFMRLMFYRPIQSKLPRLHEKSLRATLGYEEMPFQIEMVLLAGLAADEEGAERLLERYDAKTVDELRARLPKWNNRWREKLRGIFVRIEGGYMENPYKREWEEFKSGINNGRF